MTSWSFTGVVFVSFCSFVVFGVRANLEDVSDINIQADVHTQYEVLGGAGAHERVKEGGVGCC